MAEVVQASILAKMGIVILTGVELEAEWKPIKSL